VRSSVAASPPRPAHTAKTKPVSFFETSKSPPGLGLLDVGRVRFLVQTRVKKQSREGGLNEPGGREAPRLARTSTRRRRRLARSATRRGAVGWVGALGGLGGGGGGGGGGPARCSMSFRDAVGGRPGLVPAPGLHKALYVKAQPGGGAWRQGGVRSTAPLPDPALRSGGWRRPRRSQGRAAPGPEGGGRLDTPLHGAGPEGGGNGRGRVAREIGWARRRNGGRHGRSLRRGHPALWSRRLPSAPTAERREDGAVRRSAAEPICGGMLPSTSHGWSSSGGVCVSESGGGWLSFRRLDLARVGGRVAVLLHHGNAGARGRLRQQGWGEGRRQRWRGARAGGWVCCPSTQARLPFLRSFFVVKSVAGPRQSVSDLKEVSHAPSSCARSCPVPLHWLVG
jgi:hypothetical protein